MLSGKTQSWAAKFSTRWRSGRHWLTDIKCGVGECCCGVWMIYSAVDSVRSGVLSLSTSCPLSISGGCSPTVVSSLGTSPGRKDKKIVGHKYSCDVFVSVLWHTVFYFVPLFKKKHEFRKFSAHLRNNLFEPWAGREYQTAVQGALHLQTGERDDWESGGDQTENEHVPRSDCVILYLWSGDSDRLLFSQSDALWRCSQAWKKKKKSHFKDFILPQSPEKAVGEETTNHAVIKVLAAAQLK